MRYGHFELFIYTPSRKRACTGTRAARWGLASRNYPAQGAPGDVASFIGARQLWWPTRSVFEAGVRNDPKAFEQLVARGGNAVTLLAQAERFLR